jgi:hypothetical protein
MVTMLMLALAITTQDSSEQHVRALETAPMEPRWVSPMFRVYSVTNVPGLYPTTT